MENFAGISVCLLFLLIMHDVWSDCDPNKFKVRYMKACNPESYTVIHNLSAFMDRDCTLKFRGCFEITHPFKTAMNKMELKFGSVTIPIRSDVCKDLKNPRKLGGQINRQLGMECPGKAKFYCPTNENPMNIGKEMTQMGLKVKAQLRLKQSMIMADDLAFKRSLFLINDYTIVLSD